MRRSVAGRPPTPSPADERKPPAATVVAGTSIDEDDRKLPAQKVTVGADATKKKTAVATVPMVVHIRSRGGPSAPSSSSSPSSSSTEPTSSSYAQSVQSLLWNDAVATEGDKERWRGQGIDTTPSMWRDRGGDGDNDDDDGNDTVSTVASSADGDHAATAAAAAATATNGGSGNPNDDVGDGLNNSNNTENNGNNNNSGNSPSNRNANANPIADALGTRHSRWGLTQVHGGPCGVLAAVQAEMLRMLLFGRNRKDGDDVDGNDAAAANNNNNNNENLALSHIATYPRTAGGDEGGEEEAIRATAPPTVEEVREAMALAIGTILARAALAPPTSDGEKEAEEKSVEDGWVKVGTSAASASAAAGGGKKRNSDGTSDDATTDGNFCGVRIVLPTQPMADTMFDDGRSIVAAEGDATAGVEPMDVDTDATPAAAAETATNGYAGLTWDMLSSFHAGTNGTQSQLRVCTISITPENIVDDDNEDGLGPESKRQRKNSTGDGSSVVQCEDSFEGRVACLATFVAKYLLATENASDVMTGEAGADTGTVESARGHSPLQYFSANGGVLLLVLSLLECRGLEKVKSDMDDSSSTLTSQFGHSSQELINILLTGQAVSNVFDNHVDMGGGLICRGIQAQPAIGYLTQLESHRYCEVGAFYKARPFQFGSLARRAISRSSLATLAA